MKIIEDNMEDYTYVLIPFPESQEFMEKEWFEEESCLINRGSQVQILLGPQLKN